MEIHGSTESRYAKPKDTDSIVIRSTFITVVNKKQKDDKKDSAANIEDSDNTESEAGDDKCYSTEYL